MNRQPPAVFASALATALASSLAADVTVRDTITSGTWQGHPTWIVEAQNDTFHSWPAVAFGSNGRKVTRLGVVAMFTDADANWNPATLSDDDFDTEIGFFTSQADWLSDPDRLTVTIGAPSNADWLTPIGTYGGINYHYLEFDLSPYALLTPPSGTALLSVTFNPNGAFSNALGYLAGGTDNTTDYLHLQRPGPLWTGTLYGFVSQFGQPITNVAAIVTTASPPCPADLDGSGAVDAADLGILLGAWGACDSCAADLDQNGAVDAADLGVLLGAWGACS